MADVGPILDGLAERCWCGEVGVEVPRSGGMWWLCEAGHEFRAETPIETPIETQLATTRAQIAWMAREYG